MGHIHLALALAAKHGWEIQQMDVCTSFLGSVLREDIYMHLPAGYMQLRQLALKEGNHKPVWKLLRSLYGLKQSPYEWYHTLRQYLKSLSFHLSRLDGGFFIFTSEKQPHTRVILSIYVDDILLLGTYTLISQLKEEMKERFEIHDLGEALLYLGMSIEREQEKRFILLGQSHYVQTVLERFKMHESNPVSTPVDPKICLVKRSDIDEPYDQALYQSMLGSVMYLMTGTRPDISYTVEVLSRFGHDPSKQHMAAMIRLLRYLKGSKDWKLCIGGASSQLKVYGDADYTGCRDDFKSTSGFVITYGGAVDWRSHKEKSVAQSTTDAEYYAFRHACIRLLEASHLLHKMGIAEISPPVLYSDNESCLKSLRNGIYRSTEGATHISTKFFLAADQVQEGKVEVAYVSTAEMLADGFTKPLLKPTHQHFCRMIGHVGVTLTTHSGV